ncbi:MAG: hypothetical protein K9I68_10280 [Bacteroidales bacterium]|nr:hypothetical protein [Bacteroidales bacterium]MCF8337356.1 hypothetical protein [Bacteroidales bacterium]
MTILTLKIKDSKLDFFKELIRNFDFIQLKEEKKDDIKEETPLKDNRNEVNEDSQDYQTALLSEKGLAEDWLSEEDERWDQVL